MSSQKRAVPRSWIALGVAALVSLGLPASTLGRDRPFNTSRLIAVKLAPVRHQLDTAQRPGMTPIQLSKVQIDRFRCTSSGNPAAVVDISCNTNVLGQDFAPDNEIAIAVNPTNGNHLLAGSNDYFYRFNNATGARQAIIPTGFFTSFDGGRSWIDGQIPMRSGNGAGDPSPAFDARHNMALMAQLENTGGQGGPWVTQGDISVSRSPDGGRTWTEPVTVMKGLKADVANRQVFFDKEWLTVDNHPSSPFYGRAYVTATRFLTTLHGAYAESPIYLSYSDDGGRTWTAPRRISGSHPSCSYQETGPAGSRECDEDQFSIAEVAPNGTVYVHFINGQNQAAWEVPLDFDSQIIVVKSTDGGQTFGNPVPVVQTEDGLSDMPYSVIQRQTVWGHQIRWAMPGNISVNPNNSNDITITFNDRGTPNPNARATADGTPCFIDPATGGLSLRPPNYDPCNAGPGSDTDVYTVRSTDGGATWGPRTVLEDLPGHGWFPWADHRADGSLAVAWDQDTTAAPADTFRHVLKVGAAPSTALGPAENIDVSVTHWAGQYVPQSGWPAPCGPAGYSDPPVANAAGKDCNAFHGDYTGLAVGPDGSINVVWTGLNRRAVSPQLDFYTGRPHDGYAQDAMFARR